MDTLLCKNVTVSNSGIVYTTEVIRLLGIFTLKSAEISAGFCFFSFSSLLRQNKVVSILVMQSSLLLVLSLEFYFWEYFLLISNALLITCTTVPMKAQNGFILESVPSHNKDKLILKWPEMGKQIVFVCLFVFPNPLFSSSLVSFESILDIIYSIYYYYNIYFL